MSSKCCTVAKEYLECQMFNVLKSANLNIKILAFIAIMLKLEYNFLKLKFTKDNKGL